MILKFSLSNLSFSMPYELINHNFQSKFIDQKHRWVTSGVREGLPPREHQHLPTYDYRHSTTVAVCVKTEKFGQKGSFYLRLEGIVPKLTGQKFLSFENVLQFCLKNDHFPAQEKLLIKYFLNASFWRNNCLKISSSFVIYNFIPSSHQFSSVFLVSKQSKKMFSRLQLNQTTCMS